VRRQDQEGDEQMRKARTPAMVAMREYVTVSRALAAHNVEHHAPAVPRVAAAFDSHLQHEQQRPPSMAGYGHSIMDAGEGATA
jgi:hypothetical protein